VDWGSDKDPTEGASVTSILASLALLSAFIVALVLSSTASTYSAANKASKQEADSVDNLYEAAEYIEQPHRQAIQAADFLAPRGLLEASAEDMGRWLDTRPLRLTSRSEYLKSLRAFYNWCEQERLRPDNPMRRPPPPDSAGRVGKERIVADLVGPYLKHRRSLHHRSAP
jgi:site-specific recombinase XerD